MSIVMLVVFLVVGRFLETFLFIRHVSRLCHKYDRKFIFKTAANTEMYLPEVLANPHSYFTFKHNTWSAYRFLFLAGPKFWDIFTHPGFLSVENIYNEHNVQKLKDENIL